MGRKSREKRNRKQGLWVVEEISQVTPALWQKLRMQLFHTGDLTHGSKTTHLIVDEQQVG